MTRPKLTVRIIRNLATFGLGAFGWIHEVLSSGTERVTIIVACFALMGVPLFLGKDEKKLPPKDDE